eukprot:CAMPEP_0172903208 /NCGR_PEP_ID=MMETSP1075-20121228/170050_1 /TAXON_ID=2916 /ORGANISM="Ceratium fusus, Strain PA161109" /LENGTH=69 /DNA_ID=CAMNT_0013759963 /DNA_START=545 /DNA_END=755 /DNA_ORIENTATION=+
MTDAKAKAIQRVAQLTIGVPPKLVTVGQQPKGGSGSAARGAEPVTRPLHAPLRNNASHLSARMCGAAQW